MHWKETKTMPKLKENSDWKQETALGYDDVYTTCPSWVFSSLQATTCRVQTENLILLGYPDDKIQDVYNIWK